jgi:hypothetical protein
VRKLTEWFGGRDGLTRAAHGADREAFAGAFRQATVRCLSVPEAFVEGLPMDAPPEALLAYIDEAARDLSQRDAFEPFRYVVDGRRRLPVFSSSDLAAEFAKWYATTRQRIVPLQVLTLSGTALVPLFAPDDVVVLNDRTKHEYVLSPEDRARIAHS